MYSVWFRPAHKKIGIKISNHASFEEAQKTAVRVARNARIPGQAMVYEPGENGSQNLVYEASSGA